MATIVYPSTIDYRWLYQRPQQLLKAFAALGHKSVFYNNPHYYKQSNRVIELNSNFFLCTPDVPLKNLPVEKPLIQWISYPPHINQAGKLNEDLLVFDALDEASGEFADWAENLDQLASKADIVFTTSNKLFEYHSKNHSNVHMCPNGADFEHFKTARNVFAPRPKDLPRNSRPVIGYIGAVAPWIDWELMKYIVNQNKTFNFVIIGPLYGQVKDLVKSPNVYYLGRKEYDVVPQYLQFFDVCIIPFQVTSMIEACNPIKMYEYLSAGKPVVATNMPEAASMPEIYIGKSREEFNQKIHRALVERSNEDRINRRVELAMNNSWLHRAASAIEVIEETLKLRQGDD